MSHLEETLISVLTLGTIDCKVTHLSPVEVWARHSVSRVIHFEKDGVTYVMRATILEDRLR